MSKRWYVSKDGSQLGPYSASEVRDLLRDGALDPFDLVWEQGSNTKRELVDIDEIFDQAEGQDTDPDQASAQETQVAFLSLDDDEPESLPPQKLERVPTLSLDEDAAAPQIVSPHEPGPTLRLDQPPQPLPPPRPRLVKGTAKVRNSQGTMAAQDQTKVHHGAAKKRKKPVTDEVKDPKRFFIIDRNDRLLGPLSAKEIQSMFFKGVLDKTVRVMKTGTNSKVPIAKFVAVYAKKSLKEAMDQKGGSVAAGGSQGLPSAPVLQQMAIARYAQEQDRERILPYVIGATIIGILIFTSVVLWQRFDSEEWPFNGSDYAAEFERRKTKEIKVPPPKVQPRLPKTGPLPRPEEQPQAVERPRATEAPRPTEEPRVRETPEPTERPELRTPRPRPTPKATPRPTPRPKATPRPTPRPTPQPRSTPRPNERPPSGPTVATLNNGQIATLPAMSYSKSAIEACADGTVCSITFSGPAGRITGRFFKGTFGQQLLGRSGRATITGKVTKIGNSVSILITGVQ